MYLFDFLILSLCVSSRSLSLSLFLCVCVSLFHCTNPCSLSLFIPTTYITHTISKYCTSHLFKNTILTYIIFAVVVATVMPQILPLSLRIMDKLRRMHGSSHQNDRIGLLQLQSVPPLPEADAVFDICFIHDLNDDSINTWTTKVRRTGKDVLWIREWLAGNNGSFPKVCVCLCMCICVYNLL